MFFILFAVFTFVIAANLCKKKKSAEEIPKPPPPPPLPVSVDSGDTVASPQPPKEAVKWDIKVKKDETKTDLDDDEENPLAKKVVTPKKKKIQDKPIDNPAAQDKNNIGTSVYQFDLQGKSGAKHKSMTGQPLEKPNDGQPKNERPKDKKEGLSKMSPADSSKAPAQVVSKQEPAPTTPPVKIGSRESKTIAKGVDTKQDKQGAKKGDASKMAPTDPFKVPSQLLSKLDPPPADQKVTTPPLSPTAASQPGKPPMTSPTFAKATSSVGAPTVKGPASTMTAAKPPSTMALPDADAKKAKISPTKTKPFGAATTTTPPKTPPSSGAPLSPNVGTSQTSSINDGKVTPTKKGSEPA